MKSTYVERITGFAVDEAGVGLDGALSQACLRLNTGNLVCLAPTGTGADGSFSIDVTPAARCVLQATARTFVAGANKTTAYCRMTLETDDEDTLPAAAPYTLYDTVPATTLPPVGDADAVRTVVFDDGLEVDFVPGRYFGNAADDYDRLAARRLDPAVDDICLFEDEDPIDAVYGLSPEGNIINGAFDLRIPNHQGLDPGTEVEMIVLGALSCTLNDADPDNGVDATVVEEGHWEPFGIGTVSADGATIEAAGDNALPCWTWFGYRAP